MNAKQPVAPASAHEASPVAVFILLRPPSPVTFWLPPLTATPLEGAALIGTHKDTTEDYSGREAVTMALSCFTLSKAWLAAGSLPSHSTYN